MFRKKDEKVDIENPKNPVKEVKEYFLLEENLSKFYILR